MITVVALRALPNVTVEGTVYLRSARVEVPSSLQVAGTFDRQLDSLDSESVSRIAEILHAAAADGPVTYVVPGSGVPGDATVAGLSEDCLAAVHAAAPERRGFATGSCTIVDAADLATAELAAPFDRGLAPFDPTLPLVVTNWYGDRVVSLAERRLQRVYAGRSLPGPTPDLELLIEPVERLTPAASMAGLEQVIARLRRPDGCPWDRDQTRESLYPQFVDELRELGEAIQKVDTANQREELGDVLFHVIAQCQLAAESGEFTLDDVLREVTGKLVRRHPHVFGDVVAETYDDVLRTWERVKADEKSTATRKTHT